MRMRLLALVLAASVAAAGCLGEEESGGDGPAVETQAVDPAFADVGENATGGLGLAETNRTSGIAHIHDYWGEKAEVLLADQVRISNDFRPFPHGGPDAAKGVFHSVYQFPNGTIVYEGTGTMILTVSGLDPTLTGLKMRYMSSEVTEWGETVPLTPDLPLEIAVTPKMTDMPHAVASGWAYEFFADGASPVHWGGFDFTVAIRKAANVEKWPAHPDFYEGVTHRVVMDQEARTEMIGITDNFVFGREGNWNPPEKLISMGTERLTVWVNVTGAEALPGVEPTEYFLEYKHAAMQSVTFGRRTFPTENSTDMNHVSFDVWITPEMHDAPYAEKSRWAFRLMASFANAGLCPGCFPYTIDYHITVIAYPFPEGEETTEDPAAPPENG